MSDTALPTRQLGRSDMNITRVGFGAWAIGGAGWMSGWGAQDDNDSIASIRHAVMRGVNWIDTAAIYGLGHSEEVVREALKGMSASERPYVFTKCGLVWDDNDRLAAPNRVGAPDSIKREAEASLKRLGVERIDLYQMHWPPRDGTPVEDYWGAMLELKREGKVRAIGLSNHNIAKMEAAEAVGHIDSQQPPFSAIRRDFAEAELPWCEANQTGVIVYAPMQSGLLTGRFSVERVKGLPDDDWRSKSPEFAGEKLERAMKLTDTFRKIAERHGTTVPSVAVAWTLAWPGVTGAIVGARNGPQVDGWMDAARLDLTKEDMAEVAATLKANDVGAGPTAPAG